MNQADRQQEDGAKINDRTETSLDDSGETKPGHRPVEVSLEEHLEKLVELNLSSTYSSRPGLSPSVIRLLSAAAGMALLFLLYLLFKLFI